MSTDDLIEACDAALMRSKREGKGRVTRAAEPVH
jgi:PleD family two-component response regulator